MRHTSKTDFCPYCNGPMDIEWVDDDHGLMGDLFICPCCAVTWDEDDYQAVCYKVNMGEDHE